MTNKGGGYPTLDWKKNLEGERRRRGEKEKGRRGEGEKEKGRSQISFTLYREMKFYSFHIELS